MTDTLPPAPVDPYDDVRVLIDGDRCDVRSCGALAYVRVYMHKPDTTELAGAPLHWCAHHWSDVADDLVRAAMAGRCSIRDERHWLTRFSR